MTAASESPTPQTARTAGFTWRSRWLAAGVCAVAGFALFQFFGNATRGYVDTSSTFWWWISQWLDPAAETEHGWVILALSAWLLVRNLRRAKRGEGDVESGAFKPGALRRGPRPEREVEDVRSKSADLRRATRGECEVEGVRIKDVDDAGLERRGVSLRFRPSTSTVLVTAATMVAGLGLHALGFVAQQTRISIVAALLFTWGVLRLGGGRRWGAAAMFPLAFLVFAIPVNVLDSLGFWLRMWVVDTASGLARLGGIDVVRSGTQLFSPNGTYQYDVAAACSGVRSLMALAALSLLIGYVNFRSWPKRALVFALCFPLTYVGNLARVVAIIIAAEIGGQSWGERAHEVMGFGVFVIVLGGVLLGAKLLQRATTSPEARTSNVEHRTSDAAPTSEPGRGATPLAAEVEVGPPDARRGAESAPHLPEGTRDVPPDQDTRRPRRVLGNAGTTAAVAALVVALSVGEAVFLAKLAAAPQRGEAGVRLGADGRDPVELPAFVGTEWIGRRAEVTAVERAVLPSDTGFSRRNYVHVQGGAHAVLFSIVLSGRDRTSIHRPELCLVGQGWTIRDQSLRQLTWREQPTASVPATVLRTESIEPRTGRRIPTLTVYWFVNRDGAVASHWGRFRRDAWNRVRHGRADRWAYVLMQADAADGEEAALTRIATVLAGVWPVVRAPESDSR